MHGPNIQQSCVNKREKNVNEQTNNIEPHTRHFQLCIIHIHCNSHNTFYILTSLKDCVKKQESVDLFLIKLLASLTD